MSSMPKSLIHDSNSDNKNQTYDLIVKQEGFTHDFTIIYNGKRIETSQKLLFLKCNYFFKMKVYSMTNEVTIKDKYSIEHFEKFINSMTTGHLEVDPANIFEYLDMSYKYEYNELYLSLKEYLYSRPDIHSIVNEMLVILSENHESDQSYFAKEDFISRHLDESIQSGLLKNVETEVLFRILNSPNRIIRDHHLLFRFIIDIFNTTFQNDGKSIKKNEKDNINEKKNLKESVIGNEVNHDEYKSVMMLSCVLDYEKMSLEEIEELLTNPIFSDNYQPKHSDYLIKILLENNKQLEIQNKEIKFEHEEMKEQLKSHQNCILEQKRLIDQLSSQINIIQKQFTTAMHRVCKLGKVEFIAEFDQNNPMKGIISKLTETKGKNVCDPEIVEVTGNINSDSFSSLFDYQNTTINYLSKDAKSSFICFEFKDHFVSLTHYSIRSSCDLEYPDYLKSWVLEGSKKKTKWIELDRHENDPILCEHLKVATFEIYQPTQAMKFRYLRLKITGPTSQNRHHIELTNIEFFGIYYNR
ncbi:hypothetical protein TRFO_39464 [Tritrichomonas foetus]|uniref:BTB domain-containing protein n=1 Tax=Tritrichomonas foetus TaxID=1144522 RepID=A0A1J4J4P3_9EUKA|nr:hypothetical protein TRFO_39464 [Tritrichomonas foetus]|eukprot:OHS94306.1 hypothetical protein TRFO_39464 [Tritrichomonas foetus]